eukprot:10132608-Heterocapsa_arctica.AAC.1
MVLPWVPSTILASDGSITADPREALESAAEELKHYWQAQEEKLKPLRGQSEKIRRPTPRDIRKAAK